MTKPMRSPTPFEVAYATRLAIAGMNAKPVDETVNKHKAFMVAGKLLRSLNATHKDIGQVMLGITIARLTLETMEHDYTEHWLAKECERMDQQMNHDIAAAKAKEN